MREALAGGWTLERALQRDLERARAQYAAHQTRRAEQSVRDSVAKARHADALAAVRAIAELSLSDDPERDFGANPSLQAAYADRFGDRPTNARAFVSAARGTLKREGFAAYASWCRSLVAPGHDAQKVAPIPALADAKREAAGRDAAALAARVAALSLTGEPARDWRKNPSVQAAFAARFGDRGTAAAFVRTGSAEFRAGGIAGYRAWVEGLLSGRA